MRFLRPGAGATLFLKRVGTVSGFTLFSRATGFLRDVVLAWVIGAGPIADAFFIALRIPNHFRALFAEGAFNSAFVPTYAGTLEREGQERALAFAGAILAGLVALQFVILAAAEIWTRPLLVLLTPGFEADPVLGTLTTALTRITFPYLLCVTVVTVYGAVLNAHHRYAAAAGAPVLFNVAIVGCVLLAALLPGVRATEAAWGAAIGVALAGVFEWILLARAAGRAGLALRPRMPRFSGETATFLKRLGPATIGSGAAQIAMFVDTILAAALPKGAVSAMYYADRLYQLPIGVIAIAVGTVLLPDLSRRFAAGDVAGAKRAQRRAMGWSLGLTLPFVVVFLAIPELLVHIAFARGAFDAAATARAAATLSAYGVGLPAIVLMRSVVPGFHARGDTRTPMWIAFAGIAVNVALKFVLSDRFDVSGLAIATSVGAWVNLVLLVIVQRRRDRTSG